MGVARFERLDVLAWWLTATFATAEAALATTALAPASLSADAAAGPPQRVEPAAARQSAEPAGAAAERRLLVNARQITFEGARAGEGYFGADGRRMVFQSEREPGNPFFQIYLLDFETGDVERISPGIGKTTCAWLHPAGRRVLFASTHDDPDAAAKQESELELRASGGERRYSWDYDEFFELYACELDADGAVMESPAKLTNLTHARGYDAEGSYSPDGKLVAFASNRHAYSQPPPDDLRSRFEIDKSLLCDIYLMNADGSHVRRLTETLGYDGGPFFSPDGKRLCWRRFAENGATAEVFTMNLDGGDVRQLTRMGAMSWAPFYHPSGEYLIFTTNRHGFANFELYVVDVAGRGEPLRITHTDGFDGLPAFAPDGLRLAWTSSRGRGDKGQLFLADWNHEEALRLIRAAPDAAADTAARAAAAKAPSGDTGTASASVAATTVDITAADIRQHVLALASEAMEGRRTGEQGERLATQYVADCFERFGLMPDGEDGSWFQPFQFRAGVSLGPECALSLTRDGAASEPALAVDVDWRPLPFSNTGETGPADVVFAGYGIVAPSDEDFAEYDSYVHLDVTDKWVLTLRYLPENVGPERRQHLSRYSSLRYKAMVARDKGARGLIVVSGPNASVKEELIALTTDAALAGSGLPAVSVTNATAERLLEGRDQSLKQLQDELDDGTPRMGFALEGVQVAATIDLATLTGNGRNALARLRGGGGDGKPFVVLGAHVDHLGRGRGGNSLARGDETEQVHYGADDNASGVAAVLEIAEHLADQRRSGKLKLERDIVFAAWSGEEMGLLGSKAYVDALSKSLSESEKLSVAVAACLNLDMVGRLRKSLILQGVGSSDVWRREIERRNVAVGLPLSLKDDCYLPTDATSFYLAGTPILSAFTGAHEEYHTPRDTPEKLNYEGAAQVARLFERITRALAQSAETPGYIEQQRPQEQGQRAGLRAYLGTIPDYGESPTPGVKLAGVGGGGPAHAAGVRGGDVIVSLAGRTIENIYDYTYAIDALKIGAPVEMIVLRDGERMTFTVTPGSRE